MEWTRCKCCPHNLEKHIEAHVEKDKKKQEYFVNNNIPILYLWEDDINDNFEVCKPAKLNKSDLINFISKCSALPKDKINQTNINNSLDC